MSKTFQSFQQYNYRLWFGGNLFAASGQWMQRIAQDWLVLTVLTEGGGLQVGIVTALQFLPILLLSPWVGVIADRMNRRHLLQLAQALGGLLGLLLGILVLTNSVELWMVYAFALCGGCVAAFDNPVRQAFVSELVPPRMLPNAIALNSTAFNLARLIGPALSGFVIDWVGIGWVFIVNAALFAVPVVTMALMRRSELDKPAPVPKKKGQLREGLRYVRGRKDIILILIIAGVVSCLGLNFQLTSAMMATEVYGLPAGGYGLMSTSLAVGAVAGSLIVARRNNPRLRLIVVAAMLFGTSLGILALAPSYIWFLIIAVPTGLLSQSFIASANAAVQISTDPQFRGRVMALYSMIFLGTTPIGSPLVGWVAEEYGARWAMGLGAVGSVGVAAGVALFGFFHWKIRLQVDHTTHHLHLVVPGEEIGPVPEMIQVTNEEEANRRLAEQVTETVDGLTLNEAPDATLEEQRLIDAEEEAQEA